MLQQSKSIDILVLSFVDDIEHVLVIEDKTDSEEHDDQITKYQNDINERYETETKHFVYYKSSIILKDEKHDITSRGFEVYDLAFIYDFFNELSEKAKHYLLVSYIDYIRSLYQDLYGDLPSLIKTWRLRHWQNYLSNHKLSFPENLEISFVNYRKQYFYLAFMIKDRWKQISYLEIRSRDVSKNGFRALILTYGIDGDVISQNKQLWREKLVQSELFKPKNHLKQIGESEIINIDTRTEFEALVLKYTTEYLNIFK
ncbi:MAG: PD-(D/E)XK nuclease family protein [Acholeplasma sp.]|nr:PD-(D/E)XK nuclease family protein [Acholeplasma sp.]